MELEDVTSSEVTLMLLEETTGDEDEVVVLKYEVVLGVVIVFSVCEAASREVSLYSAAELDEDTNSEVTPGSDKLLEVTMVDENEAVETDVRGQMVTVMMIGVDASVGGVLVGVEVPSEEVCSVVVGVSVAV